MSREVHVRFLESVGVRFPHATHLVVLSSKSVRPLVSVVREVLSDMGLSLNLEKSRVVHADQGFDFLGFRFKRRYSKKYGKKKTYFRPSPRSMKRVKEKVRDRCGNHRLHVEVKEVVGDVNSVLLGWRAYFRCSNASSAFVTVQLYAYHRVRRYLRRRRNKPGLGRIWDYTDEYLHKELGLASIVDQGSVRYPDREWLHERGR